jgi:hypothetical protein
MYAHFYPTRLRVMLLGLLLPTVAPGARVALADPPEDRAIGDVTSYRFEDDLVRGGATSPEAEVLLSRRRNERESLVRVRTHYVPELLKAAEAR